MADLFLYGTLRHLPLLEIVLGRLPHVMPAVLPGHGVHWARGQSFPMIVENPAQSTEGIYLQGLGDEDIARLNFYEGAFAYDLIPREVHLGDASAKAMVYFPASGAQTIGAPWSLGDWTRRYGAINTAAAQEIMAWFGRLSAAEMARRDGALNIRAAARVAAMARAPDPARDLTQDVEVLDHRRPYIGFYAADEMDLRYRCHDGTMSQPVNRNGLITGQAAVVLPYDPRRDQVLLVEQFRAPVFMGGDPAPWVWEPVAGLVDPGETPEATARREAREEAGVTVGKLEPAGQAYSSTGMSNEFLHLFIGLCDLSKPLEGGGGLAGEGEDIRVEILGFAALMAGVDGNRYRDLPLLACANWLARHRARLRAEAGLG